MRALYFYHDIEEQYEDMLNNCYPEVNICGQTYEAGRALRMIDEVAFNCGCSDWSGDDFVTVSYHQMSDEEVEHYGAYNSTLMYCHIDDYEMDEAA